MDSRIIIKMLKEDGWVLKRTRGSHNHFTHTSKKGVVTVPHPKRELPLGTILSIEKQSGLKLRRKK
ncbi:MAG TPA: addiction module toxin, HicA family [Holosporales bacterium]|nr:addiction module toxin, HicA family [Holosporales bacterium]